MKRPLFTTAQTAAIDRAAIAREGGDGYALMKRAGQRAFDHVLQRYPDLDPVVVICGSGNNGGDGYVVARHLLQIGASVIVVRAGKPGTDSCRQACHDYMSIGGKLTDQDGPIDGAGLIIDGLFGAGLTRAPSGDFASLIDRCNAAKAPCVALDVPSGVDGDTGYAYQPSLAADLTVTFVARRPGLYTGAATGLCGEVVFESLAIDSAIMREYQPVAELLEAPRLPRRAIDSHKGLFGHLVVCGGGPGMLGAAILAGRAALRTGAGLVTLATRPASLDLATLVQPELMSRAVAKPADLQFDADVLVLGPGMDTGDWSRILFRAAQELSIPRVIDAGALRLLAEDKTGTGQQVLTPHPGEAAALLACDTASIQRDRIAAARKITEVYGGVCVLKGAGTVITDGAETRICHLGNPGMASAGMGDVLSGVIGALLGQGMPAFEAACAGVYLHAAAADMREATGNEYSLLATDVVDGLVDVIQGCLR